MNRKPDTRKNLLAFASRRRRTKISAPRWQIVLIALLLALAVGSAGQTPLAQAAPAGDSVLFSMVLVGNPKTKLCVGDKVTYNVRVEFESRGMPTPAPGPLGKLSAANVKVEAFSTNKNVGDFTNTVKGYSTSSTIVTVGDDDLIGLRASFPFKAKKAGTTILYFEGLVQGGYVSLNLPVKVINCKFKVTAASSWDRQDGGGHIYLATMDEAELTADAQGHYSGSAIVNWFGTFGVGGGCSFVYTITPSQSPVEMTGELGENGQLVVTLTYQSVHTTGSGTCGNMSGWDDYHITPNPLDFSSQNSGGSFTLAHPLEVLPSDPLLGSTTIRVIPVEDEAVAIHPGVGSPSAWMAELWDNFPWLNNTRLGLYP